jgi:hypothetical protein
VQGDRPQEFLVTTLPELRIAVAPPAPNDIDFDERKLVVAQ